MRRVPKKKRPPDRQDVLRQLGKLAFGKANDCVSLALRGEDANLEKLDLSLLAGVKRGKDGSVEVRLLDRLEALRELAAMAEEQSSPQSILQALCRDDEE